MEKNFIELSGVRVHNLKNISLKIPKNKIVAVCGLSGSGKSSLAFDTIFQEGQRRYLESLSSYARQFLGGLKKPDVQKMNGLSPTVAVNQKTISSNPRSTVGTLTEIHDYLRLLFANAGKPHCPQCQKPVTSQTPHQITKKIFETALKTEVKILAPVISGKKGSHQGTIEEIVRQGWPALRIDGIFYPAQEAQSKVLDRNRSHNIDILIATFSLQNYTKEERPKSKKTQSSAEKEALKVKRKKIKNLLKEEEERMLAAIKKALEAGRGRLIANDKVYSSSFACPDCQISLPEIKPRLFSFNSPHGACKTCQGLGKLLKINPDLIVNPNLSLSEGAILPWFHLNRMALRSLGAPYQKWMLENKARENNFSLDKPFKNLQPDVQRIILFGSKDTGYEGVVPRLERLYHETESDYVRQEIHKYMDEIVCHDCDGARLSKESLSVKIKDKNIHEVSLLPAAEAIGFFSNLPQSLSEKEREIARPLIKEIVKRLEFLIEVGVGYIDLAREATTLSVGENQRIRLACQLGSGLSGVIYVLDEPTIGLHQRDTHNMLNALKRLKDLDNTIIVVEHDEKVIEASDWVVEIGPGAGKYGGKIVFEGSPKALLRSRSLTGRYLSGKLEATTGFSKKEISKDIKWLEAKGANLFNLKNVDFKVPLNRFTCVVGVSGSGKSTLVIETLSQALFWMLGQKKTKVCGFKDISGVENLNKAILVDQSPIGRTPRSNPATYTGVWGPIRDLFSKTREAQIRGFAPGHFSFNTKLGRCPVCQGEGYQKVEMYFLPDIYVECEACGGKRFTPEVLQVRYKEKTIADILDMGIEEAKLFFSEIPQVYDKMKLLCDIGLGYLKLGQGATTLSGGEAQRIKLAFELSKRDTGRTIYILDEPTVGLHFDDVKKLLLVLRRLVEKGNTVLAIEHNLDVVKEADWIVELGPEGGKGGGKIIFEGSTEELAKANTATAKFLK